MNRINFENKDIVYKNGNFLFNIIINNENKRELIAQYEFSKNDNENEKEFNKKETINKIKALLDNIKHNFYNEDDLKDRTLFLKKVAFEKEQMLNFNENIRKKGYAIIKEIYKVISINIFQI